MSADRLGLLQREDLTTSSAVISCRICDLTNCDIDYVEWIAMGRFVTTAAVLLCAAILQSVYSTPVSTVLTYNAYDANAGMAEQVEINLGQNVAVFRVISADTGSESAIVVDYERNLTGVYNKEAQSCYLAEGVPTSIASASQLKDTLDSHVGRTEPIAQPVFYSPTSDALFSDVRLLPAPLQDACAGLPLLRLEPSSEPSLPGMDDGTAKSDATPQPTRRNRRSPNWGATAGFSYSWGGGQPGRGDWHVGVNGGNSFNSGRNHWNAGAQVGGAFGQRPDLRFTGEVGGRFNGGRDNWNLGGHVGTGTPRYGVHGNVRGRRDATETSSQAPVSPSEASVYLCGYVCGVVDLQRVCYVACVPLW